MGNFIKTWLWQTTMMCWITPWMRERGGNQLRSSSVRLCGRFVDIPGSLRVNLAVHFLLCTMCGKVKPMRSDWLQSIKGLINWNSQSWRLIYIHCSRSVLLILIFLLMLSFFMVRMRIHFFGLNISISEQVRDDLQTSGCSAMLEKYDSYTVKVRNMHYISTRIV